MESLKLSEKQKQAVNGIIDYYCENFDKINVGEEYKWVAVKHFQSCLPFNKSTFSAEMDDAMSEIGNLFYMTDLDSFKWLYKNEPDRLWTILEELEDKTYDLGERLGNFVKSTETCIEESGSSKSHLSAGDGMTYLAFCYPTEYYIYRPFVLEKAADVIGIDYSKETSIEKALLFNDLCNEVLDLVKHHKKLMSLYKKFRAKKKTVEGKEKYDDPEFHLLVQNILYVPQYYPGTDSNNQPTEQVELQPQMKHLDFTEGLEKNNDNISNKNSNNPKKFDLDKKYQKDKANQKIGKEGELLVLADEQRRLAGTEFFKSIKYMSKTNDNAHFDIYSFEKNGKEKFIEVKTCKKKSDWCIYFTQPEVNFSREKADNYYLYVVIISGDKEPPCCYEAYGDLTDPETLGLIKYSPDAMGYEIHLDRKISFLYNSNIRNSEKGDF